MLSDEKADARIRNTAKDLLVLEISENGLLSIWNDTGYRELRKRLQDFDFSPCAFCNSCEMALEMWMTVLAIPKHPVAAACGRRD